jgi:SAM-dependent methyltransferase
MVPNSPAAPQRGTEEALRFAFGANWADYLNNHFSDERVEIAQNHLLHFLKLESLAGLTFLDIGCGSGIHSLAAWRAGASNVISFDYDHDSIAAAGKLHEMSGAPDNWTILQGSVLDKGFLSNIPMADIVYSWGVLHHTGAMWQAIANAGLLVRPNGVFYIALYSKDVYLIPTTDYWLKVKERYNRSGRLRRKMMVYSYALRDLAHKALIKGINPFAYVRNYKESRGMSYLHDARDWLGGWPMEFAGNQETRKFVKQTLNMDLIHMWAGRGNTEFLFRPENCKNYWDTIAGVPATPLPGPFEQLQGRAWIKRFPVAESQECSDPMAFMLYEDGSPLGWPGASTGDIEKFGSGRYRIDGGQLTFSTANNRDPNDSDVSLSYRLDFL